MTSIDAAYIAGILDGEGSIMIPSRSSGGASLRVSISNTDYGLMEWIRATALGGKIYAKSRTGSLGTKPIYMVVWGGQRALDFLKQVVPYMRVKRMQAEAALLWPIGPQGLPVAPVARALRYEIFRWIRELNDYHGPTAKWGWS